METLEEKENKLKKIITAKPYYDFAFPIITQRKSDICIMVAAPDFDIIRAVPLPHTFNNIGEFAHYLFLTQVEVDQLAINEFKKRDKITSNKHREGLFPRGLKELLTIDIEKMEFTPTQAAKITTKSERTWQRWCKSGKIKSKCLFKGEQKEHHLIPFSLIVPFLKPEYLLKPSLILDFI